MYVKMFQVVFLLNYLCFATPPSLKLEKKLDIFNEVMEIPDHRARFFELPCMNIGGTCARDDACPPGTKVTQRGLCPQQQRLGMECCKPYLPMKKCSTKHGFCLLKKFTCPTKITNDITDCLPYEVCCLDLAH